MKFDPTTPIWPFLYNIGPNFFGPFVAVSHAPGFHCSFFVVVVVFLAFRYLRETQC